MSKTITAPSKLVIAIHADDLVHVLRCLIDMLHTRRRCLVAVYFRMYVLASTLDLHDDAGRDTLYVPGLLRSAAQIQHEVQLNSDGNDLVRVHGKIPSAEFVWVPGALVVACRGPPVPHDVRVLATAPALRQAQDNAT